MLSVSATIPPSTTLPVAGSWPTCPLRQRKPPTSIAWENGPAGGASSGEVIAVLFIANSCGYLVRWSEWWKPEVARASKALWASAASLSTKRGQRIGWWKGVVAKKGDDSYAGRHIRKYLFV